VSSREIEWQMGQKYKNEQCKENLDNPKSKTMINALCIAGSIKQKPIAKYSNFLVTIVNSYF